MAAVSLVIVDDLDVLGACSGPAEAYAKLVVDSDAMLSSTTAPECFQSVARWDAKIFQVCCDFELAEFSSGDALDVHELLDAVATCEDPRTGAPERFDQCGDSNAVRD